MDEVTTTLDAWQPALASAARENPSFAGVARRAKSILAVVIALAVVLAAVLVTVVVRWRQDSPAATWTTVTDDTFVGVALVIVIFAAVLLMRTARRGEFSSVESGMLSRAQRRELVRQVRGQDPADPHLLPLSRLLAKSVAEQSQITLLFSGLVLGQAAQLLRDPGRFQVIYVSVFVPVYAVVSVILLWQAHRAARFVQAHPVPQEPA